MPSAWVLEQDLWLKVAASRFEVLVPGAARLEKFLLVGG